MSYKINTNDERLTAVNGEEKQALTENEKTFDNMISSSDKYYKDQINASKQWADKQTQLQNEKTEFAIDKIEQQKAQAKKDYTKEQSGAYVDWQKQSNQYGANAEQMAAQGLTDTGYSESSQVSMYNTYQNRVASSRESYMLAVQNYNNAITEARLQNNSVLAEIAYEALQKQLELSLAGFQYKNQLIQQKAATSREIKKDYHAQYMDVLNQILAEDKFNEEMKQFDETMAYNQARLDEEKRQYNESLALQREQFAWQKAQAAAKGSVSSGGSSGSRVKKSSSKSSKSKAPKVQRYTPGISNSGKTSNSSSSPTVDMNSVLALGYGPISAKKLDSLISSGIVVEYEENGKLKYKKVFKR